LNTALIIQFRTELKNKAKECKNYITVLWEIVREDNFLGKELSKCESNNKYAKNNYC
jgi:hypothetical protein